MSRALVLLLAALPLQAGSPAPQPISFMFKQPVPVTTITETIAQLGGVNVVVGPGIEALIGLSLREVSPGKALEELAKQARLHVTEVPYTKRRPTFMLTREPIPRDLLVMSSGETEKADLHRLTFGKPTPVATILDTLAAQGRFEVLDSELPDQKLTLRLKDVSPREALHLLAHLFGHSVQRDRTVPTETYLVTTERHVAEPGEIEVPDVPATAPSPSPSPAATGTPGVRPPAIPPVRFSVNAIVADNLGFTAVIEYSGETYLVKRGTPVPDPMQVRFEVKQVEEDCVEVYDRESKRLVRECLDL